ncbi:methyltransferase domain-containing protein [bacterium]|nr:methyltransferase domain-containing protein [bacterium]
MVLDHSLTYKDRSFRNFPHRRRLRHIFKVIKEEVLINHRVITYADIGCSNGYLTNLIADFLKTAEVYGFDHSANLEIAKGRYPLFNFSFIELNEQADVGKFDFVTCFETLEHIGNCGVALSNLLRSTSEGGTLLVTVPIEIGLVGIIKFLVKTLFFRYRLNELPGRTLYFKYLISLVLRRNMSNFRDNRSGWSTHFGFDYRLIDRYLKSNVIKYRAENIMTSRFYIIKP